MAAHQAFKRVASRFVAKGCGSNGSFVSVRRLGTPFPSTTQLTDLAVKGGSEEPRRRRWKIKAAACLQRFPVVSNEKGALEQQYETFMEQLRFEKSRLSDYELEELRENEKVEARQKQALEEDLSDAQLQGMDGGDTFEELAEAREMALQEFKTASRVTRADQEGDCTSLDRQLDQILYLIVREGGVWRMPCTEWREEESLLETATRSIQEVFPSLEVDLLSNAPFAHRTEEEGEGTTNGSKIFFFKVQLKLQTTDALLLKEEDRVCETLWLTKDELAQYLHNDYFRDIAPCLLD